MCYETHCPGTQEGFILISFSSYCPFVHNVNKSNAYTDLEQCREAKTAETSAQPVAIFVAFPEFSQPEDNNVS